MRSFSFNLYGDSTSTLGANDNYTITVTLPQATSGTSLVYGSDFNTATSSLCTGTGLFTVSITPYGTSMNLNSFSYETQGKSLRGQFSFAFGSLSVRETFFTSSWF